MPEPLCNNPFRRNWSRDSESSGDYVGGLSSSSSIRARQSHSKLESTPVTKDWAVNSEDHLNRHEKGSWCRKTNIQKTVGNNTCKSTSCIPSAHKEAIVSFAESVSPSTSKSTRVRLEETRDSASAGSETSSTAEETLVSTDAMEKKKRLKSALIKRARSVAVFSLKLKEKRAKSESKEVCDKMKEKSSPKNESNVMVGGELSCVPIEMLISMDDVNLKSQRKKNSEQGLKSGTSTTTLSKTA